MKRRITLAMFLTMALIVVAASAEWAAISANAQEQEAIAAAGRGRAVTLFGMIGLARGQTARLNVVNLRGRNLPAAEPTAHEVDPISEAAAQLASPVPCGVRLRFLDQRGNTIARSVESIMPGDGAFLDMTFQEAIPRGFEGKRFAIRAIVQVLRRPEETRPCATISTLEIFDSETGRSDVIYPEPPR